MAEIRKRKQDGSVRTVDTVGEKSGIEYLREIDLVDNGRVVKNVMREGSGSCPVNGDVVEIYCTGYLPGGKPFNGQWDQHNSVRFRLGSRKVLNAWNVAVASMKQGEQAMVTCSPEFCYGNEAHGDVPSNTTLTFKLELVGIRDMPDDDREDLGYLPWLVLIVSMVCLAIVMYRSPPASSYVPANATEAGNTTLPGQDLPAGGHAEYGVNEEHEGDTETDEENEYNYDEEGEEEEDNDEDGDEEEEEEEDNDEDDEEEDNDEDDYDVEYVTVTGEEMPFTPFPE